MTRSRFHKPLLARATAWLLILICSWMGTDGVLHHSDAGAFPHASASVHRAMAAALPDACAACRWTQGMQTGGLAVCRVQSPLFILQPRLQTVLRRLTRRVLHQRSPRAPPLFLTC
jgi:hypothetical protein